MSQFFVFLRHPDGTLRVLVREKVRGKLAITTLRQNCHLPPAVFTSWDEADTTVTDVLRGRKLQMPTFPDYEILIRDKDTP
jgi:hypothetical protein